MIDSFVSTIFDSRSKAYIYVWVSKSERFVYVGQTNERWGTFGRGFSHIQTSGTLRMRCWERVGVSLEEVTDLHLLSFRLPSSNDFISNESSFRLAVEYLVQFGLHEIKANISPGFRIISNVTTNQHVTNAKVKELANQIVHDFIAYYPSL